MLLRPDGTKRVVFGFTAAEWPGRHVQGTREERVARCMSFCKSIGIHSPQLKDLSNGVSRSCVEMFTFQRLLELDGTRDDIQGTMITWVCNMALGGAWTSPMCEKLPSYAESLSEGCPGLRIQDMAGTS